MINEKKQEVSIGKQMADGLYHSADGHRFFQNGKEVSGVNELVQKKSKKKSHHKKKSAHKHKSKKHSKSKHHSSHKAKSHEPKAKPILGTGAEALPVQSTKEAEDHAKEIAAAHQTISDRADAAKAAEYKKHFEVDGLLHTDDGRRVDPATNKVVAGVNNHVQISSQNATALVQKQ